MALSPESVHPVTIALIETGYLPYAAMCEEFEPCETHGACIRGTVPLSLIEHLRTDKQFASGVFHLLHKADVGTPRVEFRSHRGTLQKGSLQMVINRRTGTFYADVDRFPVYSDVVGALGHFFGEVLFKRRKRTKERNA